MQVVRGNLDIEDEVVSLADYQTSLDEKYRSIAPAPEMTPSTPIAPAPVMEPVAPVMEPVAPSPAVAVTSAPPLPATGLPDGWTMEQWEHYGQQWLDQQGL